jgi:hypothetical protein
VNCTRRKPCSYRARYTPNHNPPNSGGRLGKGCQSILWASCHLNKSQDCKFVAVSQNREERVSLMQISSSPGVDLRSQVWPHGRRSWHCLEQPPSPAKTAKSAGSFTRMGSSGWCLHIKGNASPNCSLAFRMSSTSRHIFVFLHAAKVSADDTTLAMFVYAPHGRMLPSHTA